MDKPATSSKGLIIVFTGHGKGKTTAALGQALRAAGHGMRVCFIQFIKGSWRYGELEAVKRFDDLIDFHVTGKGFTWKSENLEKDKRLAQQGWQLAQKAIASGTYQMLVLDELTYLFAYKMLDIQALLDLLADKPADLHVLVTGRNAPPQLIDTADLVTEMKTVKHPFKAGVKAQKGIEF